MSQLTVIDADIRIVDAQIVKLQEKRKELVKKREAASKATTKTTVKKTTKTTTKPKKS